MGMSNFWTFWPVIQLINHHLWYINRVIDPNIQKWIHICLIIFAAHVLPPKQLISLNGTKGLIAQVRLNKFLTLHPIENHHDINQQ